MSRPGVTPLMEIGKRTTRIGSPYVREAIGEFFGTLILTFMCVGASGQHIVQNHGDKVESMVVPVFGIILGIMVAIVINGGVSGSHINPAVSISLAVAGELSWLSVPGYVISQFVGAIVGALLGWSLMHPMLRLHLGLDEDISIPEFDMATNTGIASIFSPRKPGVTVANGFSTELVLTCFLMMTVCAAVDKQNSFKPPPFMLAIFFPLTIAAFAFAHDLPSGTLLNPARDLGPRIAAWILGWDSEYIFKNINRHGDEEHWWIVSLFGPIVGGVLGALIYSFIIGPQVNLDHLGGGDGDGGQATGAKSDGGDWRSTVFVPKAQVPAPAPTQQVQPQNQGGYPNNNNNNNALYNNPYPQQQQQQQQQQPHYGGGGGYVNPGYPQHNKGY